MDSDVSDFLNFCHWCWTARRQTSRVLQVFVICVSRCLGSLWSVFTVLFTEQKGDRYSESCRWSSSFRLLVVLGFCCCCCWIVRWPIYGVSLRVFTFVATVLCAWTRRCHGYAFLKFLGFHCEMRCEECHSLMLFHKVFRWVHKDDPNLPRKSYLRGVEGFRVGGLLRTASVVKRHHHWRELHVSKWWQEQIVFTRAIVVLTFQQRACKRSCWLSWRDCSFPWDLSRCHFDYGAKGRSCRFCLIFHHWILLEKSQS